MKGNLSGKEFTVSNVSQMKLNGADVLQLHIDGASYSEIEELTKSGSLSEVALTKNNGAAVALDGEYTEVDSFSRIVNDFTDEIQLVLSKKTSLE